MSRRGIITLPPAPADLAVSEACARAATPQSIGDIPQNVNFAVSLGTLQSFLNANDVPYVLDDSTAAKTPAEKAEEIIRS